LSITLKEAFALNTDAADHKVIISPVSHIVLVVTHAVAQVPSVISMISQDKKAVVTTKVTVLLINKSFSSHQLILFKFHDSGSHASSKS